MTKCRASTLISSMTQVRISWTNFSLRGVGCNDPYQIMQVLKHLTKFDQELVCGPKLTFSKMNNFAFTKTPFRRPRRYEFIDGLNVKIRLTDKKLWLWGVQTVIF